MHTTTGEDIAWSAHQLVDGAMSAVVVPDVIGVNLPQYSDEPEFLWSSSVARSTRNIIFTGEQ